MKIALVAVGSRGDVEPYIALGARLRDLGHEVRVAALALFADDVRAAGLEFHSLGALPDRFRPRRDGARSRGDSSTLFRGVLGRALFWSVFPRLLAPALDRFVSACEGVDAAVHSRLALPVPHVAERFGIPCFAGFPVPHTPTTAFENPLYVRPGLASPRRVRATYTIEWNLTHQLAHGVITRFRRERLGLPALRRRTLRDHLARQVHGTLYAYSEAVVPRPADWDQNIQVTGYWFRDNAAEFTPSADVARFLADGDAPVCVSFGSMKSSDPQRLGPLLADALAQVGRRGIWQTGWGDMRLPGAANERILVTGEMPHAWLFPRVAAAIHHGGAGTTASTLRAGIPSVVVPHAFDQAFWGRQVAALGCGSAPLDLRSLTTERLVSALRVALDDDDVRAAAARLGARLRDEDGVGCATTWLERWLGLPASPDGPRPVKSGQ